MRTYLAHTHSYTYTHTYIHTYKDRQDAQENKTYSRFTLTQNTRLKANIRYLMHVSPPDSAAMVVGHTSTATSNAREELLKNSPYAERGYLSRRRR